LYYSPFFLLLPFLFYSLLSPHYSLYLYYYLTADLLNLEEIERLFPVESFLSS